MAWQAAGQAAMQIAPYIMRAVGGGTEGKASARQFAYNYFLQQQAQNWNEKMYRHRYQYQVEDLEKAGINKLYGLGTAPAVTTSPGSVGMEDDQAAENGRMANALQSVGLAQDWSAKQAQINNINQQTKTEAENTELTKIAQYDKMLDALNKKKDLDSYDERLKTELEQVKSTTIKNLAETSRVSSEIELNKAQAGNARANAGKSQTETRLMKEAQAGTNAVQQEQAKFLKNHPNIAKMVGGASALSGIIGQATGLAGVGVAGVGVSRTTATANKQKNRSGNARTNKYVSFTNQSN